MSETFKSIMNCRCGDKYTIEPHGTGRALYFGRCAHRHGSNVMHISEGSRTDILKMIEEKLNAGEVIERPESIGEVWRIMIQQSTKIDELEAEISAQDDRISELGEVMLREISELYE